MLNKALKALLAVSPAIAIGIKLYEYAVGDKSKHKHEAKHGDTAGNANDEYADNFIGSDFIDVSSTTIEDSEDSKSKAPAYTSQQINDLLAAFEATRPPYNINPFDTLRVANAIQSGDVSAACNLISTLKINPYIWKTQILPLLFQDEEQLNKEKQKVQNKESDDKRATAREQKTANKSTHSGLHEDKVKAFCEEKKISHLIHFTRISAIESILQRGLLCNSSVRELELSVLDSKRLDKKPDHICVSIGFPNYKMFYKYRCQFGNEHSWFVILIKPSLLWSRRCLFYADNAARFSQSSQDPSAMMGRSAFERLYANRPPMKYSLPDSFPSSPQAEVLIPGDINLDDIIRFDFPDHESRLSKISLLRKYNVTSKVSEEFFRPRVDYPHWTSDF